MKECTCCSTSVSAKTSTANIIENKAVKTHSLLRPKSRKGKGRERQSSPEATTSLITAEREDKKHSLHLVFPEKSQLDVYFDNRASDDLPLNIKGVGAVWHKGDSAPEGTYKVKVNDVWYNIEYINDEWYYTYWTDSKGRYSVN